MSKGAVQKYGTDTLHSMNSVGGGSGNPRGHGGQGGTGVVIVRYQV